MHTPRAKVGHHHPLIMHSLCRAHMYVCSPLAPLLPTNKQQTLTQVGHHTARASLPPQRGVGGVRGAPARAKHLLYGVDVFMACGARRLTGEDIHTTSDVKTRDWPHVDAAVEPAKQCVASPKRAAKVPSPQHCTQHITASVLMPDEDKGGNSSTLST